MTSILTHVPSGSTREAEDQHTAYNTDTLSGQRLYWYGRMAGWRYNVIALARPVKWRVEAMVKSPVFVWYITKFNAAPIIEDESSLSLSSDERNLLAVTPLKFEQKVHQTGPYVTVISHPYISQ